MFWREKAVKLSAAADEFSPSHNNPKTWHEQFWRNASTNKKIKENYNNLVSTTKLF